jgi:multidrug transporter EmrE-like cation transporter
MWSLLCAYKDGAINVSVANTLWPGGGIVQTAFCYYFTKTAQFKDGLLNKKIRFWII